MSSLVDSLLEAESHIPWVAVVALLAHWLQVDLAQKLNYISKDPFLTILSSHIFITPVLGLIDLQDFIIKSTKSSHLITS